ncbi:alpha-N-methyltransferase NTM1 [Cercophora newfieldiana]|uniref:Alpha N-terminal protein methyltransferase 1 n=1 Tax=Cercophora newfieldiana TaxID=92897 RepID=A0AA40CTX1_9PEZI|nr:alpha-N-methyltransferase NTM1 [Cercophora newfieldiana]
MTEDTPADASINPEDGLRYWEGINADDNGMLGGFAYISKVDLQGSRNFLAKLGIGKKAGLRRVESALEGGAGIGRITQGLLSEIATHIDIVEPISKFTAALHDKPGVRTISNCGLEAWTPSEGTTYDLVWTQWCVGHLTDAQLVEYLVRCRDALEPEGVIVIKENLSTSGRDAFDEEDSCVTSVGADSSREDSKYQSLFEEAGLQIVRMELQRGFPQSKAVTLLPVKMYALRPKSQNT